MLVLYKKKAIELGLNNLYMARKWDKIDINYVNIQFYRSIKIIKTVEELLLKGKTVRDISEEVKISESYISYIIRKNNFYGINKTIGKKKREFWTSEEINILKEKYPIVVGEEICKYLTNRTYDTIIKKAGKLKIRKLKI